MRKRAVGIVLAASVVCASSGAAKALLAPAGRLDPSFASRGRLVIPAGERNSIRNQPTLTALASAPGGKLVAATEDQIFEVLSNGSLNAKFGHRGRVSIEQSRASTFFPAAIAVDSKGRVLIAGTTARYSAGSSAYSTLGTVRRYLPNGQVDTSFGEGGVVMSGFDQPPPAESKGDSHRTASVKVKELAIGPDDSPVVTGTSVSGTSGCSAGTSADLHRSYVARLRASGGLDLSFGTHGVVTDPAVGEPSGLIVGPTGRTVYAARSEGFCGNRSAPPSSQVASLLADGRPDRSFGINGRASFRRLELQSMVSDRRGRLVLLGRHVRPTGLEDSTPTVQRLLSNAAPDPSFGRRGASSPKPPAYREISGLAVDRRGRVLLSGTAPSQGGAGFSFLLMRLSASGERDSRFGHGGETKTNFGAFSKALGPEMVIDGRDRVVLGGSLEGPLIRSGYGLAVARYLTDAR